MTNKPSDHTFCGRIKLMMGLEVKVNVGVESVVLKVLPNALEFSPYIARQMSSIG